MLEVKDLAVRFGGVVAIDQLGFSVADGEICGLIGPNGAGKTTLFNVLTRIIDASHGEVRWRGTSLLEKAPNQIASLGIARTFQNLALFPSLTVLENTMVGAHSTEGVSFLGCTLRSRGQRNKFKEVRDRSLALLRMLDLESVAQSPAAGLPFGTLKRIELARALAARPSLLLLDEPAGGLTHSEVGSFGELLQVVKSRMGLTILLVEHHMGLVMGISNHVVAMDMGHKIADGTAAQVRVDDAVALAYLGRAR